MSRTPKHAVILCHPKRDSFNGAVADAYCAAVRDIGHEVCLRDLYRIGFDPVLKDIERPGDPGFQSLPDVAEEVRLISGASVFVLIYSIWFGTPPAMLRVTWRGSWVRAFPIGMCARIKRTLFLQGRIS